MPYPPRPQLRPLPQFAGTARNGTVSSAQLRTELEHFVVTAYTEGHSLREIGELVDRSQTAVRRVIDKHQVQRRPVGVADRTPDLYLTAARRPLYSNRCANLGYVGTNRRYPDAGAQRVRERRMPDAREQGPLRTLTEDQLQLVTRVVSIAPELGPL